LILIFRQKQARKVEPPESKRHPHLELGEIFWGNRYWLNNQNLDQKGPANNLRLPALAQSASNPL